MSPSARGEAKDRKRVHPDLRFSDARNGAQNGRRVRLSDRGAKEEEYFSVKPAPRNPNPSPKPDETPP